MAVLDQLDRGARVAVVRLRSLGDCVLTTPALHLLARHRPDLEIGVSVEDRFRPVYEGNPDVHRLISPSPGALATWRPQLCLNLHGGPRSRWLTLLSLASRRAGFAHFRGQYAYNLAIPNAQTVLGLTRPVHTAEHLAAAMFHLGVPQAEIPRARLFAPPAVRPRPYAVLHPFASSLEKTWPAPRFLELAQRLRHQVGLEPVLLGAADDDWLPFAAVEARAGRPLREVMSLLHGATLFVGNDSGPAHVAAAFGVPVVVLFGSSDPVAWAPWRTASEVLTARDGIRAITVEHVAAAANRLGVPA